MSPYHVPNKRASANVKQGLATIQTNDYLSGELLFPADYRHNGRQAPKYLSVSGTQDWCGSWDNAMKILEG